MWIKCEHFLKTGQFQPMLQVYATSERNHLDFSRSIFYIIFVEKCNLNKIVSGVQNLLYSAISEIPLGKRPGLEGEKNLAVWRAEFANGKHFLMLVTVPFLCSSLLKCSEEG